MNLMDWFVSFLFAIFRPALGLIILAGLLLYWILKKKLPKEKFLKLVVYIFSAAIIFQSFLSTILNWWLWSQQGITQRLLPPHSPITYVLRYSWQHYWFEPVVIIFAAIMVFFGIYFLNKKFENQLFYDEEKYLAAFGILATGWPNCLIYLSLVLFLGVIFHFLLIFLNSMKRARNIFSHLIFLFSNSRGGNNLLRKASDVIFRSHPQPSGYGVAEGDERGEDISKRARWASERAEKNISRAYIRLSLLYFWLPCALLVLLLGAIISKYIGVTQLTI